jgi:3-hydroxyisobutyrate dehydrogenase
MKIGFIGLGAMGRPMAASLQRAGHSLQVYDLRPVDGFQNFRNSAAEAARDCELLFTSLPGPAEVEALAPQVGARVWFDLSTNSPRIVRRVHDALKGKTAFLDAPVSGGPKGAQTGKLAIWVGGDEALFNQYAPVLRQIGDQPFYVGPIGAGTIAKLAHNAATFTVQAALAEIFTLGVKAGVEPVALFSALRHGATGRKRTFDRLPDQFLAGVYDPPVFTVRLAHKDMTLALELAAAEKVPMRVGQIAFAELDEAMKRGWSERDFRVAMTLQEERAGVSVKVPRARLEGLLD